MLSLVKPFSGTKHIPALDGVRGLAILVVMLVHYREILARTGLEGSVFRAFGIGWCGVDLFFVLSGFLITGILLDTREEPTYFGRFYWRRFLRIFPLYYFYLFLLFVVFSHLYRFLLGRAWWRDVK